MKRSPDELLKWIFLARDHDPVSYRNICAALDAKNPSLVVDLVCGSTDRLIGSDVVSAGIMRNGVIVKSEAAFRLNNGDKHSLNVSWADAFGSAAGLTPGTAITVTLTVGGDNKEATATFPLPFSGSHEIAPGSGKYGVTVSLV
jgi:hypothetical protein